MGASDAINALRSEAVAKTGLTNSLTEQLSTVNGDAQRQSQALRSARQQALDLLNNNVAKLDGARAALRSTLRGTAESTVSMIINLITAIIVPSAAGIIGAAADIASIIIDLQIMAFDVAARNRAWDAANTTGVFVSAYSPGMDGLVR